MIKRIEPERQPNCNCGAGDDAYLARHSDQCPLAIYAKGCGERVSPSTPSKWDEELPNRESYHAKEMTEEYKSRLYAGHPEGEDLEREAREWMKSQGVFFDFARGYDRYGNHFGVDQIPKLLAAFVREREKR